MDDFSIYYFIFNNYIVWGETDLMLNFHLFFESLNCKLLKLLGFFLPPLTLIYFCRIKVASNKCFKVSFKFLSCISRIVFKYCEMMFVMLPTSFVNS